MVKWCGDGEGRGGDNKEEESLDVAGEASRSDWPLDAGLTQDLKLVRSWHQDGSVIDKTAREPILVSLRLSHVHGQHKSRGVTVSSSNVIVLGYYEAPVSTCYSLLGPIQSLFAALVSQIVNPIKEQIALKKAKAASPTIPVQD